jgi:hypothetical protein
MSVNAAGAPPKANPRWWRLDPRITEYLRARKVPAPDRTPSTWAPTRAGFADEGSRPNGFATTEWADTDWSDTRIDSLPY